MRNQTSFRLTTTLLPTDTTAKTTTVINKVDSNGDKFYPTFTEETVVLTNDDRTVMETTRAICTDGALTFVKRGLSDDASETPVENRKLTWNPGSLCFITAGAGDWIDKDDNITWSGDQTYVGDMTSQGTATYKGRLITEKGVEYPHFDSLEDLQAYTDPFGGMFAVVDSDGELYRYNEVEEEWSVVTTSTPVQPAQASTVAIGTVRGATNAEFAAGIATGSNNELLVATPAQIQNIFQVEEEGNKIADAQKALDCYLAGGKPIIKYIESTGAKPKFFELYNETNTTLDFRTVGLTNYEENIENPVTQERLRLIYSGTSCSSLIHGYSMFTPYILTGKIRDGNRDQYKLELTDKGQDLTTDIYMPFSGFIIVKWQEQRIGGTQVAYCNLRGANEVSRHRIYSYSGDIRIEHYDLYYAKRYSTLVLEFESTSGGSFTWNDVSSNAKEAIIITDGLYIGYN